MKIAMCGYKGKTGSKVYRLLVDNGYDVIGIDIEDSLINVIDKVDIVIDFTVKNEALKHILIALDYKKPFIVGTTGFTYDEIAYVKSRCNLLNVKGVICYNFSIPLNVIIKMIPSLSTYFENMEYLDIHHISKKDKKSGTTYLILLQNSKISIKSIKTSKNTITYIIKMYSKYDKMIITYQVDDKNAFALGLLEYLKTKDERLITNLLN
jgi:4-hydroxy-tetrahydrodipicolinate reductase